MEAFIPLVAGVIIDAAVTSVGSEDSGVSEVSEGRAADLAASEDLAVLAEV